MTTALRITFGTPLLALALTAFAVALLCEWIGDLARTCPDPENKS